VCVRVCLARFCECIYIYGKYICIYIHMCACMRMCIYICVVCALNLLVRVCAFLICAHLVCVVGAWEIICMRGTDKSEKFIVINYY